jgi:hypothetical protein
MAGDFIASSRVDQLQQMSKPHFGGRPDPDDPQITTISQRYVGLHTTLREQARGEQLGVGVDQNGS